MVSFILDRADGLFSILSSALKTVCILFFTFQIVLIMITRLRETNIFHSQHFSQFSKFCLPIFKDLYHSVCHVMISKIGGNNCSNPFLNPSSMYD